MLSVSVHIHRNILSANCYFRFEDEGNSVDAIQVDCLKSSFNFSLLQNEISTRQIKISAPSDFFLPTSISLSSPNHLCNLAAHPDRISLNCSSDESRIFELCFRLQISDIEVLDRIQSNNDSFVDIRNYLKGQINVESPYRIFCSACCNPLTKHSVSFHDVSEFRESELSDSWFCHQGAMTTECSPSPSVLYLDDLTFHIHQSLVESCKDGRCGECNLLLTPDNSARNSFRRFYFDKVIISDTDPTTDSSQTYKDKVTMLAFWSLVENSREMSAMSRIFLQSKADEEDICLLLWFPCETVAQFQLCGSVAEFPTKLAFKTKMAYKVLYFIGSPSSDCVKSWRQSFAVDFYRVSGHMITMIIGLLNATSKYVSKSQKTADGFSYGCLPTYSANP